MRSTAIKTILLLNLLILFGLVADVYAAKEFPLLSLNPVERKEAAREYIILIAVITIVVIATGYKQNPKIACAILPAGLAAFVVDSLGKWGWGLIRFSITVMVFLTIIAVLFGILAMVRKKQGKAPFFNRYSSPFKTNGISGLSSGPFVKNSSQQLRSNKVYGAFTTKLYHGTPQIDNAQDIVKNKGTFIVGPGNAKGTGVYLADFRTASDYAGYTGAILKIQLKIPWNQIADYNQVVNSHQFGSWSVINGNGDMGDNITNYVLSIQKKRYLKVNQNLYVALAQKTQANERVVFPGLTVLEVLDPLGNPLII